MPRKINDPGRTMKTTIKIKGGKKRTYFRYPSINIYLPAEMHEELKRCFPTKTGGAVRVIEYYFELRKIAIPAVFKKFTEMELICLIDSYDSEMDNPKFMVNKDMIIVLLDHNDRKEGLSAMYNINMFDLLDKINGLTSAEVFFLIDEIRRFKDSEESDEDISVFIHGLIGE